jgi:DNA-binding cell septation regulator SpoVG
VIYQDVCYPVTKEFREKLYAEIVREYEQAKEKNQNQARGNAEKPLGSKEKQQEKEATPFR